ncbi:MAG: cysteine--tRNA ligase, partial [Acidimicrobiales bacterium]
MLRLHDTATGTVRPLELRDPGHVSMYVCGPTVYDLPHLGHGRYALVFDVLRRHLLFSGLDVRYVSNITDVDDNIIKRAAEQGRSESEVAVEYEAEWWAAMDALGNLRPTDTPHATAYVADMVTLVAALVERQVAYETSDGVYLSVDRVPGYGLLALQPLDSLRAGARVEAVEEKRSPLDFALWKKAKAGEPSWPSPWGPGRPGWHTECVVMSLDLLGDGFDLHGGGRDLAFPHHENERAQAVALGRPFARHWAHNGWVEVGGEKMSKSLGNFTSLTDLLERSDARAYRLLVLRSHYRSPIEVTAATVADAEKGLERLDALARRFSLPDVLAEAGGAVVAGVGPAAEADPTAVGELLERMDDDLDTPGALAGVFELVSRANAAADAGDAAGAARTARTVAVACAALGLALRGGAAAVDAGS